MKDVAKHPTVEREKKTKIRQVRQRSTRKKRDNALCLKVLLQIRDAFAKTVDYPTYFLKNKSQRYNSEAGVETLKIGEEAAVAVEKDGLK